MPATMTPRKATRVLASLAEQRRDVALGLLPVETYEKHAQATRDNFGLNIPTVEIRAGITAEITTDAEGIAGVRCLGCGTDLVDDDRSPFYDAATDDGTPHACP